MLEQNISDNRNLIERAVKGRPVQLTEEDYKTIFDNAAAAITVTDENENIVLWNRVAETLLGLGRTELYLKPVKELYPPEEWQRIRAEDIRAKGIHHMDTRIITKSGEAVEIDLSVSVLKDAEGRVTGSIGIIHDISERKKAERALKESMELSKGMIETTAAAIFLLDAGQFSFVNRVMEDITGYSGEELKGLTRLDLVSPEFHESVENAVSGIPRGHSSRPVEFRIIRKDLETVWVSERLTIVTYQDKDRILGDWLDITDWKIAESASREHTRQTEVLLDVGTAVNRTLHLKDLIETVMDSLTQVLHLEALAFFLLPSQAERLELMSHRGFSEDFIKRMARVQVGKGFVGRAALTGKPVILSPGHYDPRFDPAILDKNGVASVYSVPVFARDQINGVLCIGIRDQRMAIEKDTQLFGLIANQIGMAIDNALLYERTVELAFTDALTGLYNRRYLLEELEREFSRVSRNQSHIAFLSMDVDGLKTVNDRYGHHNGDRLLREIASVIKHNTRNADVPARIGGDEFGLLAPETDQAQAVALAKRVWSEMSSKQIDINGEKSRMSLSIGIACYPDHAASPEEILKKADGAMYSAKKAGKNQIMSLP